MQSSDLILQTAGFRVLGTRADCPFCEGHRKLTVAVHGELFYCHRCQRGGSVRQLAREQGLTFPRPRVRKANQRKAAFRVWLSQKMSEMSREEHRLYRRVEWALAALNFYPDMTAAWSALAEWYNAQRKFEVFWQSANDKVGRYWLYRSWRVNAR
jgi:hypothetical protein